MHKAPIIPNQNGHASKVIHDLVCSGWHIARIPEDGKIPRNQLRLILRANDQEVKLRILSYKVTTSGRKRPHERRIEITTTYQSGLGRLKGFRDVVLGVDTASGKYVGVDGRRLKMGGPTHNASSFFDLEGLSVKSGQLLVNPRPVVSPLYPNSIEHHSFFDASRLSEYLFNQQEIHSGRYTFQGAFSRKLPVKVVPWPDTISQHPAKGDAIVLVSNAQARRSVSRFSSQLITLVEENDFTSHTSRTITPAQLKEILSICDELGALGEQVVLKAERKRLKRKGLHDQANRVERVSLWSVGEGYDIVSFEDDGVTQRYLEVKSTIGKGTTVDVSGTEWRTAKKLRENYYLVRVIKVKESPEMFFVRDPYGLEKEGSVIRTASGWRVDLRKMM